MQRGKGFTLVEVLVVIAIIGLLVGLLVPAIFAALRTVKANAIAMEVSTLSAAVTKYQQKYNDFPPDGSSGAVIQRHMRKAFPQIASSEFTLLGVVANDPDPLNPTQARVPGGVMDPAEAIVFFLGGFSDDPQFPFSGKGGPIYISDASGTQHTSATAPHDAIYQYNTDRNTPFYDFNQGQLTLAVVTPPSGIQVTMSTDESEVLGLASTANDLLPAYRPSGQSSPYVYFDKRTYSQPVGNAIFYNHYTSSDLGACRPYRSDTVDTKATGNPNAYYQFMNKDSFQLISAGLDDSYGNIPNSLVFYRFPSGESIDFGHATPFIGEFTNYADTSGISTQHDNAANFSDGVLGDALEN